MAAVLSTVVLIDVIGQLLSASPSGMAGALRNLAYIIMEISVAFFIAMPDVFL